MEFSKRVQELPAEVFATLNEKRRSREAQGLPVWDLSVGTPDFTCPAYVRQALIDAAQDPAMWRYALHDSPELLDAVCAYYKRRYGVEGITPDMVMSCRGTQEGMGYCCAALANPGDTVLIPDPCYPIFQNSATLIGAKPYFYKLSPEHGFLPYVADIPAEVADAAKYMIVSLPANPVGSVGTPELYAELIEFARTHHIVIIHDNAYSDILDGPEAGRSFFSYPGAAEVGVEYLSLSKSFNVTGARLSFLVGDPAIVAATRKLRSQVDFGMFMPEQHAAIACLTGPLEQVETQRASYELRRKAVYDALEDIGWTRPTGTGTMFVWVKLPERYPNSLDFTLTCMERSGVIVTPGSSFGPSGEGYIRMALVMEPAELTCAIHRIQECGM